MSKDYLQLVNKENRLSVFDIPPNMIIPNIPYCNKNYSRHKMQMDAAIMLEKLFSYARKNEVELYGVSAYRTYRYQKALYKRRLRQAGKRHVKKYIAPAGASEHQTGLAIDVLGASHLKIGLEISFANTLEGEFLAKNASSFGYIIRYPLYKENITGYSYEPWHIRYVGEKAKNIENIGTLEEYLKEVRI